MTGALLLLPALASSLALLWFRKSSEGWRDAGIRTAVALCTALACFTELLGFFHCLTTSAVVVFWILVTALFGILHHNTRVTPRSHSGNPTPKLWLLVLPISFLPLVAAMLWPVNNFDAMVYHVPRVFAWAQNASVSHFPTVIFRQLYQPPLFEYVLLQGNLLGAGEAFYGVTGALTLIAAGLSASWVAEKISAHRLSGPFAFLLVTTLPVSVLQASAPKNDLFLTFWVFILLGFTIEFHRKGRAPDLAMTVIVGALCLLTKGTAWLIVPVIVLFLLSPIVRVGGRAFLGVWRAPVAAVGLAFLILAPHHLRNLQTFGSPFGIREGQGENTYANARIGISSLASNMLRNLAIEARTPWAPINQSLQSVVEKAHAFLGLKVNSPGRTWPGTGFDVSAPSGFQEDEMPNPVALFLAIAAMVSAVASPSLRKDFGVVLLLCATCLSFALFSLVLKWQPWHTRLLAPLLSIGLTLVAVVLLHFRVWVLNSCVGIFVAVFAVECARMNDNRPLRNFVQNYSRTAETRWQSFGPEYCEEHKAAVDRILQYNPATVGIVTSLNEWEYPLWRWLKAEGSRAKVRHFDSWLQIEKTKAQIEPSCLYLVIRGANPVGVDFRKPDFEQIHRSAHFSIYRRSDFVPTPATPSGN